MELADSLSSYNQLINNSSMGNIFQAPEYFHVLKEIGWNPFILTVMDRKKCKGGLLAYAPIGIPVFSRVFCNVFVYLGPVIQPDDSDTLRLLLEQLSFKAKQMGAVKLYLRTPLPFPNQYHVFKQENFKIYDNDGDYSIFIDLTKDKEELWSEVQKTFRKRVRKASKEGVGVKKVQTLEELNAFYNMYLKTSQRRGFFPYPYAYFKAIWSQFEPNGFAQFLIAIYQKKVIGGMLNLAYNGKVSTFISCSLKKFWKLNANHALQWDSILRSKEELHAHTFDIFHLTSSKPDSKNKIDYYTFKMGFGGSLIKESSFYYKVISQFRYKIFTTVTNLSQDFIQKFAQQRHLAMVES